MLGLRTLVLNSSYLPISLFPLHEISADVRTHIETYCSSDIELFKNFYK
jgi:hypothetical protein